MFTGIIEEVGVVQNLEKEKENLHITIKCDFIEELKIDQSISHNGVCLTVVNKADGAYQVTAINETLIKTNLGALQIGGAINLERGMKLGDRLDGHIVQGHIDQIGKCIDVIEADGSWIYSFEYDKAVGNITIPKGSITINGVS